MAKLLIFRGDALHEQVELTEQTVHIGRSPQNDIVLEDPSRGVSRNHAEIRFENGRYVLFDRESQNGIWVSGKRVPSVALDPDVVASVGPFRLRIEAPAAVTAAVGSDTASEFTQLSERKTEPLVLDDIAPRPAAPPAAPPAVPPRGQPAATRQPAAPARPPSTVPAWYAQPRTLAAIVAAVLLIAVVGIVAYKLVHKPSGPAWDRNLAQALVDAGQCQQALDTQINRALAADPNNLEAKALRDRCAAPPAPAPPSTSTVPPPAPSASDRLDEAERLLAANDCTTGVEVITAVLTDDPTNERAKQLSEKAKTCGAPQPAPPAATEALAVKVAPAQGGLDPLPKESERDYKARMLAMRKRYDDAVALAQNRNFQQAARAFDQIWQNVPSGYLELAQWRSDVHRTLREEAKRSFDSAQTAENRNEFDNAIEAYRRAHDLDSSIDVEAAIQRVTERKLQLGTKRCQDGNLWFSYGNNTEAAAAYQAAVKLLPSSDPCAAQAQQRLKQMGK